MRHLFLLSISLDKKTKVTTCYVDVKSELLRDLLRDVLKDVRGISLNESKLSVSYTAAVLRPATHLDRSSRTYCILHFLSSSCARARMKSLLSIS